MTKRKYGKLMATLMALCFVVTSFAVPAKAQSVYDTFLLSTGMPMNVLEELDEETKMYIYENSFTSENEVQYVGHERIEESFDEGQTRSIPESELDITVTSFVSNGVYHIYPSFEWKHLTNVKYDHFAFAIDEDDWTIVPEEYNLRVWDRLTATGSWQMVEDITRPSVSSQSGFGWTFSSDYNGNAYVKGNAFFYATPNGSPQDAISVGYADVVDPGKWSFNSITTTIKALSVSFSSNDEGNVRKVAPYLNFIE